jgi:hypothetical protein
MKLSPRLLALLPLLAPALVFAVYAPIPEQEQGKALTVRLGFGMYHDDNIFGAASGEISSTVYNLSPSLVFNSSVSDQTFVSANYDLNIDHVLDRPDKKNLVSHAIFGRVAHSFSSETSLDVSERYSITENPASLLAGLPLATDQSYKMSEFNARFATSPDQKVGLVFKARHMALAYDLGTLARGLDRSDILAGVEASFAVLPETKVIGEYRFLDVGYDTGGATKDKRSHFLLAGVDHTPGKNLTLSGRAGFEDRTRSSGRDLSSLYAELSGRYAYAETSFLSGGYTYTVEEPSDTFRFSDTKVNRFFVNVQHQLSGLVTASGSVTYEPSELQGRGTQINISEKVTRFGAAFTWSPTKSWFVSATYDFDKVDSDDAFRNQNRTRYGVSARLSY